MRIAILHNALVGESLDERDVLDQRDAVAQALGELGHESSTVACDLDLSTLDQTLRARRPDLVFNLIEALGGHGRLAPVVPRLLDALRVPYTGCSADAIYLTSHKLMAKELMRADGVPTPRFARQGAAAGLAALAQGDPVIVKSVWEDASIGLDDASVMATRNGADLESACARLAERLGGECFAERYVDGREFNLSLFDGRAGPEVFPAAEMRFDGFPAGKPRIMGYAAKWDEKSFEYERTQRTFELAPEDGPLVARMVEISLRCHRLFGLGGYARVDFRVRADGTPYVLEVNANPCITPGSGFPSAAERAGVSYRDLIGAIVERGLRPDRGELELADRGV